MRICAAPSCGLQASRWRHCDIERLGPPGAPEAGNPRLTSTIATLGDTIKKLADEQAWTGRRTEGWHGGRDSAGTPEEAKNLEEETWQSNK